MENPLLIKDRLIEDHRPRAVQQETRRLLGRRLLLERVKHPLLIKDRLIEDHRPRAVQQETRRLLGRRLLLERVENRLLPRRASRKAKRS